LTRPKPPISFWVAGETIQKLIGGFGRVKYGRPLFHPDAGS